MGFFVWALEERGSTELFKMLIRDTNGWETSEISKRQYPAYSSKIEQHSTAQHNVVQATLTQSVIRKSSPYSASKLTIKSSTNCKPHSLPCKPAVRALNPLFPHLVTSDIKSPNVLNIPSIQ